MSSVTRYCFYNGSWRCLALAGLGKYVGSRATHEQLTIVIMCTSSLELLPDNVSIIDLGDDILIAALLSMVDHEQSTAKINGYQLLGNVTRYCVNN